MGAKHGRQNTFDSSSSERHVSLPPFPHSYTVGGKTNSPCPKSMFLKKISLVFMFSCMSDIEHYQNEYENGRARGILRNNPLANRLGMVEDGLSNSPIKVLALTRQGRIGRTYLASDLLHYFYFVTPPSAYFKQHISLVCVGPK